MPSQVPGDPCQYNTFLARELQKGNACTKSISDELSASGRCLAIATTSDIIVSQGEAYRWATCFNTEVAYVLLAKVQAATVECDRSWDWRWAQMIPTISLDANSTLHYVFYVPS